MFSYLFPALINSRRDESRVLVKIAEEAPNFAHRLTVTAQFKA